MMKYDGTPVKVVTTDDKGHVLLEVTETLSHAHAPVVGSQFWTRPDDEYFPQELKS